MNCSWSSVLATYNRDDTYTTKGFIHVATVHTRLYNVEEIDKDNLVNTHMYAWEVYLIDGTYIK